MEIISSVTQVDVPTPVDWSAVAIRLLQGVIYRDDSRELWEQLIENVSSLTDYFGKLGLQLVVDEADTMAYLKQTPEDAVPHGSSALPRLFRRTPLGYDATLLAVLLRDELRLFEEQDVQNERCVIAQSNLLELWGNFFPNQPDAVRLNRSLAAALRKLEELKFVRPFEKEPATWEVRRIIKARLPLEDLEKLRVSLIAASGNQSQHAEVNES